MTSFRKPTPEEVDRAVALIARREQAAYFFDKLENPEWIVPLRDRRVFAHPPPTEREGSSFWFPPWPAVRWLVRMAAKGEEYARAGIDAVLEAPEIDNHVVHLDYAELALASPAEAAVSLVEHELKWIDRQDWLFDLLPDKYSELAVKLARSSQFAAAKKLLGVVLSLSPTSSEKATRAEPKARFDAWFYGEVLKDAIPALRDIDWRETLGLLLHLLHEAANIEAGMDAGATGDGSMHWRPAVEDNEQNWNFGKPSELLVDATRDTIESALRDDVGRLTDIISSLRKRAAKRSIFQRLLLHVIRVFREPAAAIVREQLIDVSQFQSREVKHEYSLLLRDGFPLLSDEERKRVLDAVEAGPVRYGDLETPEARAEFATYSRFWKRDRLSLIQKHLDASWRSVYEGLVKEFGQAEHPEFSSYHQSWSGPTSPKTADELAAMPIHELVEYLVVWRPKRDFMDHSAEGLGRALEKLATNRSQDLLREQEKLRRIHPEYIGSIVAGLTQALKSGAKLDQGELVSFLSWVSQQTTEPYELPGRYIDRDWTQVRRRIVWAFPTLLGADMGPGMDQRERIWDIVSRLAEDPDPREERETDGELRPSEIAINSVRGGALEGVIHYASWLRRWQQKQVDADVRIRAGMNEMPEVRELLERHLEPSHDKSRAIRSVYGQWFPWLVMLDQQWAATVVDRIFPTTDQQSDFFDAAWLAYLSFNQVYRNTSSLLGRQYAHAVALMGQPSIIHVRSLRPPAAALGGHLVAMYAYGDLRLDSGTLADWFARADGKDRETVLADVGRGLMPPSNGKPISEEERASPEVLARLQQLWDIRVKAPEHAQEASAFGWWFASGLFDDRWAIEQLAAAAKLGGRVDALHFSTKRLTHLADSFPAAAVTLLDSLLQSPSRDMWSYSLRDAIRPIFEAAKRNGGSVWEAAKHVINRMAERGLGDYGGLLQS